MELNEPTELIEPTELSEQTEVKKPVERVNQHNQLNKRTSEPVELENQQN